MEAAAAAATAAAAAATAATAASRCLTPAKAAAAAAATPAPAAAAGPAHWHIGRGADACAASTESGRAWSAHTARRAGRVPLKHLVLVLVVVLLLLPAVRPPARCCCPCCCRCCLCCCSGDPALPQLVLLPLLGRRVLLRKGLFDGLRHVAHVCRAQALLQVGQHSEPNAQVGVRELAAL